MTARGCLSPRNKVCVAAPASQISSEVRVFFRISDRGCEPTLSGHLLFPSLSTLVPSYPSIPYPFSSPPLAVGP